MAAAGLVAEVAYEIVHDPGRVGRVTRQVPAAAAPVTPGEVVRLFVGKNDEG
ncbi:MAG TPA: PASTA domain-containing protein [Longimicrobium sp.]|nr:PASTA domain-containing protein [Longimicrobium sp.]